MPYDPDKHQRRSLRLPGYDYAQAGAYCMTICTQSRQCLFGEVINDKMVLNAAGEIVYECWCTIPHHFVGIGLDAFVVMPNHMHGIIMIRRDATVKDNMCRGEAIASPLPPPHITTSPHGTPPRHITTPPRGTQPGSLGAIIQNFKSLSTGFVNHRQSTPGVRIWQRNYYEHIIRNEAALNAIRQYIQTNPLRWARDKENPINVPTKH